MCSRARASAASLEAEQRLGERLRRLGGVRQQKLQLATSSVMHSQHFGLL